MVFSMQEPWVIWVVGAQHTGVQALALALQAHLDSTQVNAIVNHWVVTAALSETELPTQHTGHMGGLEYAALTLLMGLDLPCPASERARQEAADGCLRALLHRANVTYKVVYGQGGLRIRNALSAIQKIAVKPDAISAVTGFDAEIAQPEKLRRAWDCDKCSDPECEFRLFTRLTGGRPRPAA